MAGIANSIVSGPVEHIRTRLQIQPSVSSSGTEIFKGPIPLIRSIYSQYGMKGIFKGQSITLLREGIGYGVYFSFYENLIQMEIQKQKESKQLHFKRSDIPAWKLCTFGGLSGYVLWISIFHLDVIKTKIQTDGFTKATNKYGGILQCSQKIWLDGGLKGFYRGKRGSLSLPFLFHYLFLIHLFSVFFFTFLLDSFFHVF